MTDYLEALIDSGEQNAQEQALSWKKLRFLPARLMVAETGSGFADGVSPLGGTVFPPRQNTLAQADEAQARNNSVAPLESSPATQPVDLDLRALSWSLELELRKLRRAVHPQKTQSSAQPSHSPQQGFSKNSFFLSPASGWGGPANYAELVDMHFARDARRYDGPLRLL